MQTNKKTMLAAALAVAIVALAGTGYALANDYKAVTTNDGNTMVSAYLKLTQDGTGSYHGNLFDGIAYDTYNTVDATTIKYVPLPTHVKTNTNYVTNLSTEGTEWSLVTKQLQLHLDKTQSASSTTFDVTVDISNCISVTGLSYQIVLGSDNGTTSIGDVTPASSVTPQTLVFDSTKKTATATFSSFQPTFDSETNIAVFNVYLFINGEVTATSGSPATGIATAGFNQAVDVTTGETTTTTTDSVFTFTVTPAVTP